MGETRQKEKLHRCQRNRGYDRKEENGSKKVKKQELLKKAEQFNIQHGEAEAVALYWQENADMLATDDDNVRKKEALRTLREIGWFSNAVIDTVLIKGVEND